LPGSIYVANLKTLFHFPKIGTATQNLKTEVVWNGEGHSWSLKMVTFNTSLLYD